MVRLNALHPDKQQVAVSNMTGIRNTRIKPFLSGDASSNVGTDILDRIKNLDDSEAKDILRKDFIALVSWGKHEDKLDSNLYIIENIYSRIWSQ